MKFARPGRQSTPLLFPTQTVLRKFMRRGGPSASSLLTDLAAYWKMEEAGGAARLNSVIGAGDLTDSGTVTQQVGRVGQAAGFAGAQTLSVPDSSVYRVGGQDWTLAGWVYFTGTGLTTLWGKSVAYHVFARTNQIEARSFDGSFNTAVAPYTQAATTWYFVCVQYVSSTKTLSISINNGTPGTVVTTNQLTDDGTQFSVGDSVAGFGALSGRVDELGLWKRALTPTQITALYNAGAGTTYPFTGIP